MIKSAKITSTIILVTVIVIVVNILSETYNFRIDLTEGKEYTLSNATREILKNLDKPVTITAYFSKDLPANIGDVSGNLRDMLVEYGNRSGGMVVYKFVNPNENENLEREAVQNGIQPIMINVREKDHGEPDISDIVQVYSELRVLYNVEALRLTDTTTIPEKYKTIAIIRPVDTIPAPQLSVLDKFLARGGNIFLALNRVQGNFQNATGTSVSVGMEDWLRRKGITIADNFIIDANCGVVTLQQQQGTFTMSTQVQFPYLPVIHKFADNPVTKGLESVSLQFASPITFSGDSLIKFIPIAFSSDKSGSLKTPLYFDIQKQWQLSDFPMSGLVVAGILEGKLSGNVNSKIILVSDGDFAVGGQNGGNQLPPDNISLLVNSIDWLSDDTGLIELRTKGVTSRPIKKMEDSTKALLKWLNFLAPIVLIIIYGLIRMQMNRNKRIKRMEVNYE
jgi:ABC-type uncharacterized transport system involved in gliding motility auxiliary subunit